MANPAFTASATGAINGDTFSFTESTTATTSSPVGTYAIVPVATGTNLANYTVVYVNGTLTVGQATLTVTAGNASRAYGVANPVFSASATGAVGSDTFSFTESRTATTSSPVGTYAIVPVATGTNLGNYTVVYVNGTLTVGRATLTVTAGNASRAYGVANPVFSASATGAITTTPSVTESTTATTSSPVGTYDRPGSDWHEPRQLHGGLCQRHPDGRPGDPDRNRRQRQPRPTGLPTRRSPQPCNRRGQRRHLQLHREHDRDSDLACRNLCDRPGSDWHEPRELHGGLCQRHPDGGPSHSTVAAGNASRAYGVANPAFSASATGAINGDTFSFTESTTATISSPVGTYAIVPVATGTNLANYTVVYVNGTLTVGQATLTVTAGNASRAYGVANPTFTASATGAVNGDTFTFTKTTTATTSSPGGTYAIVPVATGANLGELARWSTSTAP